jgi:hypothetical protein
VAAAVAAGPVFELDDVAVVDAGRMQRARRRQAGDASTDDERADLLAATPSRTRWPRSWATPSQPPS